MGKQPAKEKKVMSDRRIRCILFFTTFILVALMGLQLNLAIVLDETGVVANAAYVAGNNWHDWVNETGRYFYKYGSALLYIPVLYIFNNPYVIYKLIMVVNAALVAMVPVCAYQILVKHLRVEERRTAAIMALITGIVPASVLYSLNAKSDVALITWNWVLILVILECDASKSRRQQYILSVAAAFFSTYLYMCHTRGIVFVIAAFMTVFTVRFILKEKAFKFLPYLISLAAFMYVDKRLTKFFKTNIWGPSKLKNTMDGVKLEKYKKIPTFTGAKTLIRNASGWLTGSITGTYGLVIAGVFITLCIVFLYMKKRDVSKKEFILSFYGLLVFVGTMALGMLFFFSVIFKFTAGYTNQRADRFFYSRYMSPTYAMLVLVALYALLIKKEYFGRKLRIFVVSFSAAMIGILAIWIRKLPARTGFSWRNALDVGLFYNSVPFGNDASTYDGTVVARALLTGSAAAFILFVVLVIWTFRREVPVRRVLGVVCVLYLGTLLWDYVNLRYNADMRTMNAAGSVFTEMENIVDQYDTVCEEFPDIYYDSNESKGYKFYQMGLTEFNVLIKGWAKFEQIDNAFIIARSHMVNDRWLADDCYLLADYDYDNNVNGIIIKGDELRDALEKHGIHTVELPSDYGFQERTGIPSNYWRAVENSYRYQFESFK